MFTKEFIKNYDENGDKGYILEVDVEYPKKLRSVILKNYVAYIVTYHFYQKE